MASVHDVAAYVLAKKGEMSTWKFQKLLYYSQAWHLAWEEEPMFDARIEAWANGPVAPEVYRGHRTRFSVGSWGGDGRKLTKAQRDTIDYVLDVYGDLSGRQLSLLTHSEQPWQQARKGLAPTEQSSVVISPMSMQTYYQALDMDENAQVVADIDWTVLGEG
jgi:uncharacterized phage-associated protein